MKNQLHTKICKTAFTIFRAWTKRAAIKYPDLDFTIKDETLLVNDFEESLQKAVESLALKEKEIKSIDDDFRFGYFVGTVQGYLDSTWIFEYIAKHSSEYRYYLACKALLEYLRFDTLTGTRVNKLYNAILESETNLQNIQSKITELKIEKYKLDEAASEKQYLEKSSPIYTYLENQLSRHIVENMEKHNISIMPALDSYFSMNFIYEIMRYYEE